MSKAVDTNITRLHPAVKPIGVDRKDSAFFLFADISAMGTGVFDYDEFLSLSGITEVDLGLLLAGYFKAVRDLSEDLVFAYAGGIDGENEEKDSVIYLQCGTYRKKITFDFARTEVLLENY